MPASRIAAFTPSATFSTIAGRPISSGFNSALIAAPMVSLLFEAGPVFSFLANTVACGVMTPSQPPDQTIGIRATSASLQPCLMSTRRNAWSARMRVKSLTPPLPSVLPITATTSLAANWPARMRSSSPEASCTVLSSTFATSIAILALLPVCHFGITRPAVDHGGRSRALRSHSRAQLNGRHGIDGIAIGRIDEHNAVALSRGRDRDLVLHHVAQHPLRLALERVAPAPATRGQHAHDLARAHRLAIHQAAELAWRALRVDTDAERLARCAAVDAVAAEPHAVGGHDRAAVDQRAVVLVVAEPAAALAGTAGVRA